MKKVPGKFAIFCSPVNKINEELIKTAGKKTHYNQIK